MRSPVLTASPAQALHVQEVWVVQMRCAGFGWEAETQFQAHRYPRLFFCPAQWKAWRQNALSVLSYPGEIKNKLYNICLGTVSRIPEFTSIYVTYIIFKGPDLVELTEIPKMYQRRYVFRKVCHQVKNRAYINSQAVPGVLPALLGHWMQINCGWSVIYYLSKIWLLG